MVAVCRDELRLPSALAPFSPEWNLENLSPTYFLRWHTYILRYNIYAHVASQSTHTRTFLPPASLMNTSHFCARGLLRGVAGRRTGRRDRISVASVSLHVTRQMRRWLVPARNLSLVRCPPAEISGSLAKTFLPTESANLERYFNSRQARRKCGKCELADEVVIRRWYTISC